MLMFSFNPIMTAGVDEAGRGPLAGGVFAAAVILPPQFYLPGLTDSKKLSSAKRQCLDQCIRAQALAYCIASATVEEIDTINILQASLLAMQRAINGLSLFPHMIEIDGTQAPKNIHQPYRCIIKGDLTHPHISAASILAKVTRDEEMLAMDARYPVYGFAQHKGYGTAQHLSALYRYGPCPIHRKSFAPIRKINTAIID